MNTNLLHIVYHPTLRGYSGYSREMDGLQSEGRNINELYEKIKYLIEVRIKVLLELGRDEEAIALKNKKIIFTED